MNPISALESGLTSNEIEVAVVPAQQHENVTNTFSGIVLEQNDIVGLHEVDRRDPSVTTVASRCGTSLGLELHNEGKVHTSAPPPSTRTTSPVAYVCSIKYK